MSNNIEKIQSLTPEQEEMNKERDELKDIPNDILRSFAEDEDVLRDKNKKLEIENQQDKLTGLYNRGTLFEKGQISLSESMEKGEVCSVIMMDYDNFKIINDTYGHQVGDEALRELSRIMRAVVPESGLSGRYGGEEFAIFLPGKNEDEAKKISDEIRLRIEEADIEGLAKPHTISVGCAGSDYAMDIKDKNKILELLFKRADDALYASKRSGKNKVTGHNGGLDAKEK